MWIAQRTFVLITDQSFVSIVYISLVYFLIDCYLNLGNHTMGSAVKLSMTMTMSNVLKRIAQKVKYIYDPQNNTTKRRNPWPKTVYSLHLRSKRVLTFKQESYWVKPIRVRYKWSYRRYTIFTADWTNCHRHLLG